MPNINPSVSSLPAPPIMEAHGWARRYDGRHGPMLDLCQAVPGYPPHPELLARIAAAAADPAQARYGLIQGDLALREAYAAETSDVYGGAVDPDQVAITAGCNQAFFVALLTLASPGDNVLLPTPWFWNHQQSCVMLGIEPRPLAGRPDHGFIPDPDEAARLIDSRTRAIVLIAPNNPTGAVIPPATIRRFMDLCASRQIVLILDETYRDFLPEGQARAHDLFTDPAWPAHLVQLYSFSKAWCIPGHRVGAVTADAALVQAFVKALDCLHICPQRPAQSALAWAIPALSAWRAGNREMINRRAEAVRQHLAGLPGWRIDSLGTYFAYLRHPFPGVPSAQVAERLTVECGAMGLPGSAFGPGQDAHLRLAFAGLQTDAAADLANRLRYLVDPPLPAGTDRLIA